MMPAPEESSSDVTAFSIGVGGPLGFGGNISPAKLAFVHGLADRPDAVGAVDGPEGAAGLLEVRVHGVGGSSPEQILEQTDYVQVGGDSLAQFIRRWGGGVRIVPWPLATNGFWHGQRPVTRLQRLHLAGAAGLISLYLAWVPASHQGWRVAAIIAALVIIAAAGLMLAWPHAGRPGSNPYPRPNHDPQTSTDRPLSFDRVALAVLAVAAVLLAALVLARLWWRPEVPPTTGFPGVLPGDAGIWEALAIAMGTLVAGTFLLTLTLKVVIAWAARRAGPVAADPGKELRAPLRPFACGFLGPAALCLACLTGGILSAGVNLAVPRLLIGSAFQVGPAYPDRVTDSYPVELPWPLFGFMSGLLVMLAAVILLLLFYALPRFFRVAHANMGKLPRYYPDGKDATKAQLRRIAWQWSGSRAADQMGLLAAVLALTGLAGMIAFFVVDPKKHVVEEYIGLQQWLVGVGAVALYGYTVSAFSNQAKRTRIQALWDVGTFWPRACQPFAPPCYMERSVPELINRLYSLLTSGHGERGEETVHQITRKFTVRLASNLSQDRLAADLRELTPHYERILVNGYSQGAPISAAVIAQLPGEQVSKISLITVGAPLRRLYGRGFPIYFGPDCLDDLRALLGGGTRVRWRNAVRKSDYIGDFVFADPYGDKLLEHFAVDKAVLDPVCVTPGDGDDATVPVIHGHSDFWPDPQVALMTLSLLASSRRTPPLAADDVARELA